MKLRINHRHLRRIRESISREERLDRLARSVPSLERWERWAGTEEMAKVARQQQDNARAWMKLLVTEGAEGIELL